MQNGDNETRVWVAQHFLTSESVISVHREYTFAGTPSNIWIIMRLMKNFTE